MAEDKTTRPTRNNASKPARATPPRKKRTAVRQVVAAAAPVIAEAEDAVAKLAKPLAKTVAPVRRRAATTQRNAKKTVKRAVSATRATARTVRTKAAEAAETAEGAFDATARAATGKTAATIGVAAVGLLAGLAANFGRKMLVQAPSALAGDWFDALKAEHRLALALFDKLQATGDTQSRQRGILLTQLKHALGKHAFAEENVIYPALRAWGDKADADKLNHDHGYVKQYLYELGEMDDASPAFLAKLGDFRAALEAHIREEEQAIFPPLHKAMGRAGNAKITALANKEGFKLA